ncbi:condensin-2 complex subunit D3 isoform X2 [Ipomoea triloba]|uniref:condensin-2 complex subunit D3 isoform X1 n=1 Tax=Ipomoea triloba TaxID=35885 RepID=UPI00125E10AF|nr:condensin-2 complex subunit D3 isoform X1 [Ipomoea triloba]XP_031114103.1 condensin-2 complex subunit D3 isoform X2 [Ipomoea triloba]
MEEATQRIVADLETQTSISEATLKDLQSLLDYTLSTQDSIDLETLYHELSSRNLSPTTLSNSISSTMDSAPPQVSLLASTVYLSLLLSPNCPVFTLFTPMAFMSLLRSIRRALKNTSSPSGGSSGLRQPGRKRQGSGRGGPGKNRGKNVDEGEDRVFDVRVFFCVLERLELVMGLVHLDRFPDCLKSLVQTVADIPVMASEFSGDSRVYMRLCELCSRVLSEVLKAEHGDLRVSTAELLKSLTPLILLVKSQAKTFALEFVVNRMVNMAKDSPVIKEAVVNFPKYLAQKSPEKAEPRASAVVSIIQIVKVLHFEDQIGFADFVVKMTQGKGHLRLLAVDLIPALIMSLKDPLGWDSDSVNPWGLRCLDALIQRCSDATAGIRARALTVLAQLVVHFSGEDRSRSMLKELMGFKNDGSKLAQDGINYILKSRCMDEKAAVRKAALLLISKLTALLGSALDEDLLKTVSIACCDPLVSIRKVAISALSEAFRLTLGGTVTKEWLHSVPRLITDNETSIQEECENLFLELVLDRISLAGSSSCQHQIFSLPESNGSSKSSDMEIEQLYHGGVLLLLREICNGEVTPWVKKICVSLGKKKKVKPKIAIALQNIIRASESLCLSHSLPIEKWTAPLGAWFLLSEVSAFLPQAVDWEFLHHHWQLLDKYKPNNNVENQFVQRNLNSEEFDVESNSVTWAGDRVFLLQTISNVSVELPAEPAADLAHNLLTRLEQFNMHSTEVDAHVKALRTLCKRKALSPEEADSLVTKWVHQLLSKVSKILDLYISKNKETNEDSAFLTPPSFINGKGKRTASSSALLSQTMTAVHTVGCLIIVCPSAVLKSIIPVLHTIITSDGTDPRAKKLPGPSVSIKQTAPTLYVQAWLTMGKICLADGKLAKRYIPLFVQELEKSDCAALRNNIVVMMADFCVRHTSLVDCYLSKITKCLRDSCELVRRQTFILLARLLQRDYVKWRGVLFLRFLLSLVDESEKIRQLADFLFGNILKVKAPLLAYNSFVEAIFALNDCNAHTGSSNSQLSRNESRLFSIRGNDAKSRSSRMHIYATLLKQMAPEHHLATFAKVCAEILGAASDGMLNLGDTTAQSVLQDAFQILSSKDIRISTSRGMPSDSPDIDEEAAGDSGGASASASAAAVRGNAITQAVKKGLIQTTIPIFIELKRLLESKNSPLVGSLMECLRILLKDYKNEIEEILVADKQLQKELIYDMQKYESMKAKSTAAEAVATLQRSDSYQTPADPASNIMKSKLKAKLHSNSQVASAMADATAAAVLREVNQGAATPPLSAMRAPKLKSCSVRTIAASRGGERSAAVIESLRRRQSFDSDDEN